MQRRLLQAIIFLGGFVPVGAGAAGMLYGLGMVQDTPFTISADSHYRYLSGLLLGIGLGFWSTIPAIEKRTERFRLLSLIVVIGGVGRLLSLFAVGAPNNAMLFGLVMELVVTPLLAFWQFKLTRTKA